MIPHNCSANQAAVGVADCELLLAAYILAGLAMMLNIRLSYSSAPYALIRFRLPENLFSVFVRRMASALELWCLPSMLLGNIMDLIQKLALNTVIDENLRDAAGATAGDPGKLRQLAQQLYTQANLLYTAVIDVGTDDAAKVLLHKAGADEQKDNPKYLRKLATELYNAANALATAVASGEGSSQAQALAAEVGATENDAKLRQKLKDLGNYTTNDSQLNTKATAVRDAYGTANNGVKQKYDEVVKKEDTYESAGHKHLYDAVVKAMNSFNAVYRPEELLKDEVGDNAENSGLTKELKALGSAGAGDPTLPGLVKAVRDKYSEGWGDTVNSRFNAVVAQAPAYKAGNKTGEYENLLDAWTNFNNKYHDAISHYKYYIIISSSIITQWLNFLTYVILLVVYVMGGDQGHLTVFYFIIAISGVVFGINMTLVYSVDFNYIPVYIVGENCFPIITSFIHYITTLMFGNRRKWNSDFIVVYVDIAVAILISFVAAVVWTYAYVCTPKYSSATDKDATSWHHIFTNKFEGKLKPEAISPFLMIVVGMGLVYAIYPGIAPGMIVPFYLIDKIEMVLLIATFFPPVIVAALRRSFAYGDPRSPMCKWTLDGFYGKGNGLYWHAFDLLMVIKISLAYIFIYSLHYRDSNLSRSIVNQPKMSTFLSIVFYMCHECLLALGFPGLVGANEGGDLVLIPQYIGALFMIFLAFYSEGYIIEYKSHDPAHWPTEGMTKWNAFCYWCKRASKITNHNLRSLFTTDLRRDLLLCIQKNELI